MRQVLNSLLIALTALVFAIFCVNVYQTIFRPSLIIADVVEFLVLVFLVSKTALPSRFQFNSYVTQALPSAEMPKRVFLRGMVLAGFFLTAASAVALWLAYSTGPEPYSFTFIILSDFAFLAGIAFVFAEPLFALFQFFKSWVLFRRN